MLGIVGHILLQELHADEFWDVGGARCVRQKIEIGGKWKREARAGELDHDDSEQIERFGKEVGEGKWLCSHLPKRDVHNLI
jgi:hypothetical protein